MRRLLQSIIHNRKLYDRPQDEWTCGRAAEGCPCVFGPGKQGECRATGQCLPARKGDRWVCTRPISLGGACSPGPAADGVCGCPVQPCSPVHSLRARRGRLTRLVTLLAAGFAILAVWGWTRTTWSSPGPVTAQHAMSAQRCADCHIDVGFIPRGTGDPRRLTDSNLLCLKCHDLGAHGNSPHGVPAAELIALSHQLGGGTPPPPVMLRAAHALAGGAPAEMACATCHQEHHGRDADIKHLSDRQCQVCHQAPFASFASGHPEFTQYPATRRTRLQFDHVSHWQKHFPELAASAPTSCAHCHEPAADGRKMLVRGFDQTCAQCHSDEIKGAGLAGAKGFEFLRLPKVDIASLEAAGEPIGEWPEHCDGDLTPFMGWLLEGDPIAQQAMTELGSAKLGDLAKTTPAQTAAAARLVWSVKGLMADLVTKGQQIMMQRNEAGESAPIRGNLTGGLPADALEAAQKAWLPNLLTEVAAYRRGEKPASRASKAAARPPAAPGMKYDTAESRAAGGGWYRRDDNYTVYYRPVGHADEFLVTWLATAAHDDQPSAQAIFKQLSATTAPGLCMKCHTVDGTGATAVVNWLTARPEPDQRPFTTFKHEPHFNLMGDQGCATCHVMDPKSDYVGAFGANRDPKLFHSSFAPLTKESCVACHQPQLAGSSCLQCHNYHTGELAGLHQRAMVKKTPAKP
jgi:hypothetical protein